MYLLSGVDELSLGSPEARISLRACMIRVLLPTLKRDKKEHHFGSIVRCFSLTVNKLRNKYR